MLNSDPNCAANLDGNSDTDVRARGMVSQKLSPRASNAAVDENIIDGTEAVEVTDALCISQSPKDTLQQALLPALSEVVLISLKDLLPVLLLHSLTTLHDAIRKGAVGESAHNGYSEGLLPPRIAPAARIL